MYNTETLSMAQLIFTPHCTWVSRIKGNTLTFFKNSMDCGRKSVTEFVFSGLAIDHVYRSIGFAKSPTIIGHTMVKPHVKLS